MPPCNGGQGRGRNRDTLGDAAAAQEKARGRTPVTGSTTCLARLRRSSFSACGYGDWDTRHHAGRTTVNVSPGSGPSHVRVVGSTTRATEHGGDTRECGVAGAGSAASRRQLPKQVLDRIGSNGYREHRMRLKGVSSANWVRRPSHEVKDPDERWLRELYPWPVLVQVECGESHVDIPRR